VSLYPLLRLELLRQRRQPMVMLSLVLVGVLGTPLAATQALERGDDLDIEDALSGEALRSTPRIQADATFAAWVTEADELELVEGPLDEGGELEPHEVIAHVTVDPDKRRIRVETGPRGPKVRNVIDRIKDIRDRHDSAARVEEAENIGVDLDALQPEVHIERHERADTKVSPWVLYGLPWLMTMLATTGTLYGAIDVLLSERLHHTAETILTSAATRRAIAIAKAMIVAMLGVGFAAASLGGLAAGQLLGLFPSLDPAPGPLVALGALGVAAVLAVQLSAIFLGVATFCEDHKSAGLVAGPMLMAPPVLATVAAFPGPSLSVWSACVPVTNILLVWRDALLGTLTPVGAVGVALVVAVQVGLSWRFTARRLADPDIVTGQATAEGRRKLGRYGPDALTTYALALASFWFIGVILQQLHLEIGLVLSQLSFVAIGLGAAAFFGMGRDRLRLRRPALVDLAFGVGIGLCTPALATGLMAVQELVFPGAQVFAERFGASLGLERPLWVTLLLFAVLPGLCEELLFRSALLGMLERDARPVPRVLLVAFLFALLHLSVFRLAPTMVLGVVAGWLTLRSRSVWPAVAFHVTHNAASFAVASSGALEVEPTTAAVAFVASVVVFGALATAVERRQRMA